MTITHQRPRIAIRGRDGFTMLEVVVALFITALVLLASWTMFGAAGDQQLAGWREADHRGELAGAERVLTAALLSAGRGMPSSPGLGGVHVTDAGEGRDTLYVFEGVGPRLRIAARTCAASGPICVAVLGDQRRHLRPGALVLVGSAGAGLRVMRVAEAPALVSDACGADCMERVLCALVPAEAVDAPAVAGSVLQPPAPGTATPSTEPCPQPVLADGTTCSENQVTDPASTLAPSACTMTGPSATFTEIRLAPDGGTWGLPIPQVPPALRAGSAGTPAPLLQGVDVARFWVRHADSTLVKQSAPAAGGAWTSTQPIAGRTLSLAVETRHSGDASWRRGLGLPAGFLEHGAHNTNFVRASAPADSAPRAWRFRAGYHTVAAVRLTLGALRPAGPGEWTLDSRALVVATPSIRGGARSEGGS